MKIIIPILLLICSCGGAKFNSYASGTLQQVNLNINDQNGLNKVFPINSLYVFKIENKGDAYEPMWNIENRNSSRSINNLQSYIYGVVPNSFKETISDKELIVGEVYGYEFSGYSGSNSFGCFTVLQNHTVKNLDEKNC